MDKDEIEIAVFEESINYEEKVEAINLIVAFAKQNEMLLVGGSAIDLALRMKGDKLYHDNAVPDYDFIAPNFHNLGLRFASLLCKKGYKEVSVINAYHIGTIRVGIDHDYVLDISYSPPGLYYNLPRLTFPGTENKMSLKGMKIIHPKYQKIDMLRSISHPYEISSIPRIKKDMKRFAQLERVWPNKYDNSHKDVANRQRIMMIKKKCDSFLTPFKYGGIYGLIVLLQYLDRPIPDIPDLSYYDDLILYTTDREELITEIKNKFPITNREEYNRISQNLPEYSRLTADGFTIFVFDTHKITFACVDASISPYLIMSECLMFYTVVFGRDKKRHKQPIYLWLYNYVLDTIEDIIKSNDITQTETLKDIINIKKNRWYHFLSTTIDTFGYQYIDNRTEFTLKRQYRTRRIKGLEQKEKRTEDEEKELTKLIEERENEKTLLPKNHYFRNDCRAYPSQFKPQKSYYFLYGGSRKKDQTLCFGK